MQLKYDYSAAEALVAQYLAAPEANLTKNGKAFSYRSRLDHTLRVRCWCARISDVEKAAGRLAGDDDTLYLAATVHDVGYAIDRAAHAAASAVICETKLAGCNLPTEICTRAAGIVALHSAKALPAEDMPPELRILQDADTLDELGAMRVAWLMMEHGNNNEATYASALMQIRADVTKKRGAYNPKTAAGALMYEKLLDTLEKFADSFEWELCISSPRPSL